MYSACGPQVDVFELDHEGALKEQAAVQSFSLVAEEEQHRGALPMDFGGLRHGGHVRQERHSPDRQVAHHVQSCDLSPDGTKLYVADMCVRGQTPSIDHLQRSQLRVDV